MILFTLDNTQKAEFFAGHIQDNYQSEEITLFPQPGQHSSLRYWKSCEIG